MGGYSLLWLPDVLRSAGLEVEELEGWQTRGHGDVGDIRGVMCHHTCGPPHGNIHLRILVDGRTDLVGPLASKFPSLTDFVGKTARSAYIRVQRISFNPPAK